MSPESVRGRYPAISEALLALFSFCYGQVLANLQLTPYESGLHWRLIQSYILFCDLLAGIHFHRNLAEQGRVA